MAEPPGNRERAGKDPSRQLSHRRVPPHPEQHRPRVRREIPTTRQLGVGPTRILLRGTIARCPACGGGHVFRRWFLMEDRCPSCTLHFERVDGHWIGSLGANTVVVFGVMFVVLFSTVMISYPDTTPGWLLWVLLAIALFGPVLFFPPSRMLWTAIDILMRPLRDGEIDPRYVAVDPYRDRPVRQG
ncbi:MAG: DUF983 domain-containing protein [Microthrixaceae bacterium]|nr:DUF983 domain-containing protein [Microthrixaceae bacterium]MCO5319102.1 DUF983 domain-containing protein [Microthrixaceae bacterium]